MTWRSIPDTVVYRWPGTRSAIVVFGSHHVRAGRYTTSFVFLQDEEEPSSSGFVFELSGADGEGRVVVRSDDRFSRVSLVDRNRVRKMILAFLVEIGVDRVFFGGIPISEYITSAEGVDMSWSKLPRWVPDDLWDDRYDSVLQYIERGLPRVSPDEDWLGYVPILQVRDDVDASSAKWGWTGSPLVSFDTRKTAAADTLRDLVDAIVINEKLLPERDRERWLSENLVFGQFVVPHPDEVELYRVLGERLPLLWPTEQLIDWLEERAGS